jgi:hypothetical protein
MYKNVLIVILALVTAIHITAAIRVTAPASAETLSSADDFATAAFQDPWDMNQQTDLGWFVFDQTSGSSSNLSNISFSNGVFSASSTSSDPNISILETGVIGTCFLGKIGTNYKINADNYKMLAIRAKFSQSHNSLLFWSKNTIYNGVTRSDVFSAYNQWAIYVVNIPSLGAYTVSGSKIPWSGNIDSLRYDPVPVKANIDIDWIRLVENTSSLYRTITWAGNSGNVHIYLDNDQNEGNGNLGLLAYNVSGTSYRFNVGALQPGVKYYVGIKNASGGGLSYSGGYYKINDIPTLKFTAPSEEGGDDFATTELGNAWDMNAVSDLDKYTNLSGTPSITTVTGIDRAGNNLGKVRVLKGSNRSGSADPTLFFLWFYEGRGAQTKIDSSKYRILVLKMGIDGNWDLNAGSVARLYWHVEGEFFSPTSEKMHQSADVIVRHKNEGSGKVTIDTIITDMNDVTLEGSQSNTGWKGSIDGFRIDPHEFSGTKNFYIHNVKLAAYERADDSYTFKWNYTDSTSRNPTLALYYDTNNSGYNGSVIKAGIDPSKGQYTWDTSRMAEGTYYIYAIYSDGMNSNRTYARWPIVIDHTQVASPAISLSKTSMTFNAGASNSQTFSVSNSGGGTLNWTVSDNQSWLSVSPTSGQNTGTVTVTVNRTGLSEGTYTGTVTVTNADDTSSKRTVAVTLKVGDTSGTPAIKLSRDKLYFGAKSGAVTGAQQVLVSNSGSGTLYWKARTNYSWLKVSPSSGVNSGLLSITADTSELAVGKHEAQLRVVDSNDSNSIQRVYVTLQVYNSGGTTQPTGEFSTPADGSTVRSSIPVTGWVVDDVDVTSVKIYNGSSYIGDAVFVEGARPDVAAAFPEYPKSYQAGWGYMLLTNYLPNGGNGTYTLYAKATDAEGHQVTLGSKTITVDNANAVNPFGAIDSPAQGGTASGSKFINWGWVLTPQPNSIKTDGSTIDVWVDGVNIGHPKYNQYRSDIAKLFPGYANTNGAVGFFYLDTTAYENGIHSIQWTAKDSANNSDGIGSRYFTIINSGNRVPAASYSESTSIPGSIRSFDDNPIDASEPVRVKRGYRRELEPTELFPTDSGDIPIEIKEMEPLQIQLASNPTLTPHRYIGYLLVGEKLAPLPIGSTLDTQNGTFHWKPGHGFFGNYQFIFIDQQTNRIKKVNINIVPKY